MKVLAIGATGFIGSHVVRLLAEQGHDVVVLHRGEKRVDLPAPVRFIYGDRNALAAKRVEIEQFAPDVVVDVIPFTEKQARDLMELMRGIAGRVVAVSSVDVYRNYDGLNGKSSAPPDPTPLNEDAPLRENLYPYRGEKLPFAWIDDYDKILVERAVMNERELPGTVLRLPAVYGPGDRQHRLRDYVRRMDDNRPAILLAEGQADWRWTRGYVENVAAAVALAVSEGRAAGRVYNVGEEQAAPEREWIQEIAAVTGWKGRVVAVPAERLPDSLREPADWRYHLAVDTRRLREELGYREPVSQPEALARTIAWERAQLAGAEPMDYSAEDAALNGIDGS